MSKCTTCDQMKADWKREKMEEVQAEARIKAETEGKPMAIVKITGCIYQVISADKVGDHNVIQYISSGT